jgi:hypothetical protein
MTQAPAAVFKIPTVSPQPPRAKAGKAAPAKPGAAGLTVIPVTGVETRSAARGDGEVVELDAPPAVISGVQMNWLVNEPN